jgi:predicted outer membrane repeat protein
VDGYEILRRRPLQEETELTTLVDNTGSSETSYTDTSATTPGERYVYGVKSIRGEERSDISESVSVDFVSASCEILTGNNHEILQCTANAGDLVITSAQWIPSYEVQYAQTTDGPVANWVIADEYCGQSTTVEVEAQSGESVLMTAETTITLECAPAPADSLTVSCENLIENSRHILRCALSGGDQTITSAQWTPGFDDQSAQTTEEENAAEATWVISAEYCGQTTSVEVVPSAGEAVLPTVATTFSLPCVITVDDNCSLANAIRSANASIQVEEGGDSDGNDDCEAGADPDESASPPETGDDIILLTANITLPAPLPAITSRIQIEGDGRSISGDGKHQVFNVSGGQLSISDLTVTKGLSSTVGGGIYINSGTLSITDSVIKDNVASDIGGGIYAVGSNVDIADSEISGNSTTKSHGGGLYFTSSTDLHTLAIVGATFKKNTSTEDGGALKTAGGITTIAKSTFVENTADEGGAIESSQTTLDITNSTFSKNSAREGGGLSSFSSFVTLTHTTWAYNSAEEQGGGIAIIGWMGSFKIRNTLITDSKSGGDCHSGPNPNIIIQFTGNFIQDGSCTPEPAESQAAPSGGAEAQAQAQQVEVAEAQITGGSADPMISGLRGNPPHHPLQWGSPAIDAADPAYCSLDDQPDTARPQYGNCDIGAYEYPKPPPPALQPPDPPNPPDPPDPPDPPGPPDPPDPSDQPDQSEPPDQPDQPDQSDLPTPTLAPDCIHVVSEGENLYRIAILYDMTVRELSSFNNLLNDDRLSEGQELIIPFDHCVAHIPRKG